MTPNDFSPPDFTILAAAFAAGVGMLLGAVANLLFARFRLSIRTVVATAATTSGPTATTSNPAAEVPAAAHPA